MRGRLERAAAVAGVEHLPERALEVDRLGRRAHGRPALAADPRLDRADQAGLPAGGLEDGVEQERGRRLAARAGHARDLQRLGRAAEELVGRDRHRLARAVDHELRHRQVERPLDHERDGAVLDRLRREVVAVRLQAGDAEEEAAGAGPPRVVGEVEHVDAARPAHDVPWSERGPEALQVHRAAAYRRTRRSRPHVDAAWGTRSSRRISAICSGSSSSALGRLGRLSAALDAAPLERETAFLLQDRIGAAMTRWRGYARTLRAARGSSVERLAAARRAHADVLRGPRRRCSRRSPSPPTGSRRGSA